MFSLISGLWQYLFRRPSLHILIIGLDHAGKTTLLERIKSELGNTPGLPPDRIPPTVGMNLAKIHFRGAQAVFWDLGGQVKVRSLWQKYYQEADAVVYVVDAADLPRIEEAKAAFDAVCDSDELSSVPIFTFANKQDLPGALSPGDLAVSFYQTDTESNGTVTERPRVLGTSGVTGDGLTEAIAAVLSEARRLTRRTVTRTSTT